MSSKRDALGLYIKDAARRIQSTSETLRTVIIIVAVAQLLMTLFMFLDFWPILSSGKVGFMTLMPFLMLPVGLFGVFLFANYIRYVSDMLVLISFKLVEDEITEQDAGILPAIPVLDKGPSPIAGNGSGGEGEQPQS